MNTCPIGLVFGEDFESDAECLNCQLYEACQEAQEETEVDEDEDDEDEDELS